jgi:two-component system, NarL family, response regulator LiaR
MMAATESKTPTIRVLIVDDHEVVRRGLVTFLSLADGLEVVGEAGTGAQAVRLARRLRPDVVLMDLMLPDMDGVSAICATREAVPDTRVLALTGLLTDELVLRAIRAGATGYLLKDIGALGLVDAIRTASVGQSTLAPEAAQVLVKHATGQAAQPRRDQLTGRERDVLQLMARGLANAQIAQQLVISRTTANFHVSGILEKLGVSSRTRAVAIALQSGLVAA